jgi:hypothetical protein
VPPGAALDKRTTVKATYIDGTKQYILNLANDAINAWETFFTQHGVS